MVENIRGAVPKGTDKTNRSNSASAFAQQKQTPSKRQYDFESEEIDIDSPYSSNGQALFRREPPNPRGIPASSTPPWKEETCIKTAEARKYATVVSGQPSPGKADKEYTRPESHYAELDNDYSSSFHSDDAKRSDGPFPSPGKITPVNGQASVLMAYSGWRDSHALDERTVASPKRGKSTRKMPPSPLKLMADKLSLHETSNYSPLTPYFVDKMFPGPKKGSKTLIGENGWLQRTCNNQAEEPLPKKSGIIDSIKKKAKEFVRLDLSCKICLSFLLDVLTPLRKADHSHTRTPRRAQSADRAASSSRPSSVSVSLDPREQSLLYCELEFILSTVLHCYITNELHEGRLSADKLARVAEGWAAKGRPRVSGFRYDLETQLELVRLHLHEFRFYGRRHAQPVEVMGLIDAMATNARTMRVRTFCWPDSVIAKQLLDAQALLATLAAPDRLQRSLAEVIQFFKIIVERERETRREVDKDRAGNGGEVANMGQAHGLSGPEYEERIGRPSTQHPDWHGGNVRHMSPQLRRRKTFSDTRDQQDIGYNKLSG